MAEREHKSEEVKPVSLALRIEEGYFDGDDRDRVQVQQLEIQDDYHKLLAKIYIERACPTKSIQ